MLLAGALGGFLSGCNTASPAATVNGQVITQGQLDQYLQEWSTSSSYVQSYDQAEEEQYEEQLQEAEQEGESADDIAPPGSVQGTGSGPAVYGMTWAATEIRLLITQVAVQQYLAKHKEAPTPVELAAAWASQYAVDPPVWLQLNTQARTGAALWDADHALVDVKLTNAKSDKLFYEGQKSYFWSKVCVETADISVENNGQVDMAASAKQAKGVADQLSGQPRGAQAPVTGGALYCLSPEQLLQQPSAFRSAVAALAPGHATELAESFGYEVVEVRSRATIPYNNEVADDIDIVAVRGESSTTDTKINNILSAAKIEVNPSYPGI